MSSCRVNETSGFGSWAIVSGLLLSFFCSVHAEEGRQLGGKKLTNLGDFVPLKADPKTGLVKTPPTPRQLVAVRALSANRDASSAVRFCLVAFQVSSLTLVTAGKRARTAFPLHSSRVFGL